MKPLILDVVTADVSPLHLNPQGNQSRLTSAATNSRLLLRRFIFVCVTLAPLLFASLASNCWALSPESLTVNGRTNPLGIAAHDISFGWSATSAARGAKQTAYQIRVGTSAGLQNVWDSGKTTSAQQVDVALPAALQLSSSTRYFWQVRLWDQNDQPTDWSQVVWFETGLLAAQDWTGAEWLVRPVMSPNANDWTNYTVTVDFTLRSEAFGIFLRSSADAQNAYMFQVNVTGASPVFKPHKRTGGTYTVLATINLGAFGYSNSSLLGTTNRLSFDVSGSTIITRLNGVTIDTRTGISYPRGLVGFRTFSAEAASVHRIEVLDKASGAVLVDPDFSRGENGFSGGVVVNGALQISGTVDAVFANLPPSLPLLRGRFEVRNGFTSARVYASAQGIYELSVNGQKAGDQFLAPGWTDYSKRIQSQTYDITDLVQPGTNVIGAALADGWFRGKVGLAWTRVYGNELALIAKIKVSYSDGSSEWFSTTAGWKTSDGPCVQGDLQDGEMYNANLEQPGWNTAAFNDSTWRPVGIAPNVSSRLTPQPDEPIRAVTVLTAKNRTEVLPRTWLYDLGQNMVGVPRLVLSGRVGETITIRHGEEIYRTGAKVGQLYTENLRTAKATDTYTFSTNGTATYQPRFTQHGFRYIEITGTTNPPAIADVIGVVLSSELPEIGQLETSNPLLNQLVSNIRWGQQGNFLSIPTDTPARDERLGWTGDINVFAPTAARFKDTRAFLSKWMADVRDAQKLNGNIPAVVPQPRNEFDATGVGWSDAFITVPYSVWRAFGDEQILRENWAAMKTFYQFVSNSAAADGDLLEQGRSSWFSGDWLTLESVNRLEEHKVIATAYFAENTRMMSEMAAAMGEPALAKQWAALVPNIRAAFVSAYRNADGSIYTGTQTAYALALGMDMIADPTQRAQTAGKFIGKLAADNYHLKTGFLGTPWLLPALSKIGRPDLSMRLLLNEDYPSWGFPISIGATTMWERWNSIQPNGEFGPVDMNSFNHYAYGAVGDWMFEHIGGLKALEPGYRKARVAPLIGYGGLNSARARLRTSYGALSCAWVLTNNAVTMTLEVPPGASARVLLPTLTTNLSGLVVQESGTTIWSNGAPATSALGVTFATNEMAAGQTSVVWEIDSGEYQFTWTIAPAPSGLTATALNRAVSLTWNSVPGATSYNIRRALNSGGPYALIASGVTDTNYTDYAVTNGIAYHYVVSARVAAESLNSSEAMATPRFVHNFGFETPPIGAYQYDPPASSWMFTPQSGNNGSGITANGTLFNSSNPNAPEGTQVAFLQSISTISQTVSGFLPGASYALTFSAAQRAGQFQGPGQTWDVKLDDVILASYSPPKAATNYEDYTAEFTASAASHTVTFVGTNLRGGDNTVFIDNVRVAPKPSILPPQLAIGFDNGKIAIQWPAANFGWRLQVQTNSLDPTNWITIPGADLANDFMTSISTIEGSVFFRLVFP